MLYERKGHLHILRKPEPHSVDTVLGGTGTSLQIRWARTWWLHGHRSFNVDNTTFCGTTYQQQYCNQQQSFRNLKDSQPENFWTQIPSWQLWKVRLKYWKFVDPPKNHEDPARYQKPPCATCFQHIHRNKCHNLTKLAHRIQFLFRVSSTHGRFLHYWEVSKQSVRPEECGPPLARATKEADKARWLPLLRLSEKNRSFKNCGPQSYIESQLLQANLALFLYISNLNRKISKKTCSNSLPEEKLGRKKLSRPEFCSTPPWLSMFFVQ